MNILHLKFFIIQVNLYFIIKSSLLLFLVVNYPLFFNLL